MINKWDEIKNQKWDSLLLGNGFSIGVSDRFSYKSLLDNVEKHNLRMYPHAKDLFIKIGTTNFEEILRVIYHAYLVNFYNLDAIKTLYHNVRRTLIDSVNISHVEHRDVPTERIESELKSYSRIFTTNYDLIPYWSFMSSRDVSFCDFFWNGDCVFNINDTDIRDHKKPIFYLHGAIHLKKTYMATLSRQEPLKTCQYQKSSTRASFLIPLFLFQKASQRLNSGVSERMTI